MASVGENSDGIFTTSTEAIGEATNTTGNTPIIIGVVGGLFRFRCVLTSVEQIR